MTLNRKALTRIITFLGGLYFVIEFLLPKSALEAVGVAAYHDNISTGFITVGAVSFGLGLINLLKHHGSRVLFVRKGWIHSGALLTGLVMMMGVSLWDWYDSVIISHKVSEVALLGEFAEKIYEDGFSAGEKNTDKSDQSEVIVSSPLPMVERIDILIAEAEKFQEVLTAGNISIATEDVGAEKMKTFTEALELVKKNRTEETFSEDVQQGFSAAVQDIAKQIRVILIGRQAEGTIKKLYDFLFIGLFTALGSAMFSLLAVYIVTAAYRAFVVKSFESFLMMSAAVLVILGQTSFGLYISEYFPAIRLWLLEVPNSAAFRAIKIGAGVAGLVMALRMWFSIESETFSGENA
jgi:hypothetical protein